MMEYNVHVYWIGFIECYSYILQRDAIIFNKVFKGVQNTWMCSKWMPSTCMCNLYSCFMLNNFKINTYDDSIIQYMHTTSLHTVDTTCMLCAVNINCRYLY